MPTTTNPRRSSRAVRWAALVPFLLAAFSAAALGGLAVSGETSEYRSLEQPSWAPPSEVFGPVWTVLYVMIAVAGWLAWTRAGWGAALWAYAGQLVLNAVWSPLFFGAGLYGLAFLDIVLLWMMVGVTMVLFFRISRPAGLLLVPYWCWITFAGALNLAIWQMN
jgi:translocator protein